MSETTSTFLKLQCAQCRAPAAETPDKKLLRCGGCRAVAYCGKECQKEHWALHKPECNDWKRCRGTLRDYAHNIKDSLCGVCKVAIDRRFPTKIESHTTENIHHFGCGHYAHIPCLIKRNNETCPTCGVYGKWIPTEGDVGAILKSSQKPWYQQDDPKTVLRMALGYIFQAEIVERTHHDGSVNEELLFITKHFRIVDNELYKIDALIKAALEAGQVMADAMIRSNGKDGADMDTAIMSRINASFKLRQAIAMPFLRDNTIGQFLPSILKWLQAIGL